METDFNPFLVSGYKGPDYFCDRTNETKIIRRHIGNGINTTLFAIRRLGKTGLIHHVFESYVNNNKIACIYVDILGTKNLREFTNQLGTSIYNHFPQQKSVGKKLVEAIKLLRPTISFDALTGSPELNFELGETRKYETTIQQLFSFLDQQKIKIVFAIDEFQQILEYPEKNTEAILRTYIQGLKNTQFIFCGSNQRMMHELFNSAKRPFFASCTSVYLDFIDGKEYSQFIYDLFNKHKRKISNDALEFILDWTCRHTLYTQRLCNFIYSLNVKKIDLNTVQLAANEILNQNESVFYQYRNLLTDGQWNLLRSIAKEGKLFNAHAKNFISTYKLGTSSMITRGIDSLLAKEMIYYNSAVQKPYYEVYDKFLMRWLQR